MGVVPGVDGLAAVCSGLHVSSSVGPVAAKMSWMHLHVFSHMSDEKRDPLDTTRFSRQFVPDRASCSLSGRRGRKKKTRENVGHRRNLEHKLLLFHSRYARPTSELQLFTLTFMVNQHSLSQRTNARNVR